jgi:hypothetical protein
MGEKNEGSRNKILKLITGNDLERDAKCIPFVLARGVIIK